MRRPRLIRPLTSSSSLSSATDIPNAFSRFTRARIGRSSPGAPSHALRRGIEHPDEGPSGRGPRCLPETNVNVCPTTGSRHDRLRCRGRQVIKTIKPDDQRGRRRGRTKSATLQCRNRLRRHTSPEPCHSGVPISSRAVIVPSGHRAPRLSMLSAAGESTEAYDPAPPPGAQPARRIAPSRLRRTTQNGFGDTHHRPPLG